MGRMFGFEVCDEVATPSIGLSCYERDQYEFDLVKSDFCWLCLVFSYTRIQA